MVWNTNIGRLARATAVAAAAIASTSAGASATTVDLSWSGVNGYSAIGSFTYNGTSAPTVIAESGAGATKTVQSFSITFFDPAHTVLESGSAVIAGVSSDRFFQLTFNTLTSVVSVLDGDIGGTYIYFLTDLRTSTGSVVLAGSTGFNFFDRRMANAALDTATSINAVVEAAQPVPEPASVLLVTLAFMSLLAFKGQIG